MPKFVWIVVVFVVVLLLGFGTFYLVAVKKAAVVTKGIEKIATSADSSSPWAVEMLGKYPYDKITNSGVAKSNFPDRVTVFGKISSIGIFDLKVEINGNGKSELLDMATTQATTFSVYNKNAATMSEAIKTANFSDMKVGESVVVTIMDGDQLAQVTNLQIISE